MESTLISLLAHRCSIIDKCGVMNVLICYGMIVRASVDVIIAKNTRDMNAMDSTATCCNFIIPKIHSMPLGEKREKVMMRFL